MVSLDIIGIATGILSGIIFSLLFFSMDAAWKRFSTSAGSGIFFYAVIGLIKLFSKDININDILSYTKYFFSFMVSTIAVCFIIMWVALASSKEAFKLSILDFIVGNKKVLEQHLSMRKKTLDILMDLEKIESENEKLNRRRSSLEHREKTIESLKSSIEERVEEGVNLLLPIGHKIPVDSRYLEQMPDFVKKTADFTNQMKLATENCIKKADRKDLSKKSSIFFDFLSEMANIMSTTFFNPQDVRVHYRYLGNNSYNHLLIFSNGKWDKQQTVDPIPLGEGIIKEASRIKRSVIKSINEEYHFECKHDHKWKEYMTLVFDEFFIEKNPLITMGVSFKNKETYRELLFFLNHCNIEQIIQEYLIEVHKKVNIFEIIEARVIESVG